MIFTSTLYLLAFFYDQLKLRTKDKDILKYISSASIDYLLSSFQTRRLRTWTSIFDTPSYSVAGKLSGRIYAIIREVLQNRASRTTGHNKSTVFAVRCIWRRAQATDPTNAALLAHCHFN